MKIEKFQCVCIFPSVIVILYLYLYHFTVILSTQYKHRNSFDTKLGKRKVTKITQKQIGFICTQVLYNSLNYRKFVCFGCTFLPFLLSPPPCTCTRITGHSEIKQFKSSFFILFFIFSPMVLIQNNTLWHTV